MSNATNDDDDSPEWTDADFARARPFSEMFPELARKLRAQGGRPRLARPKVDVRFRLAADVVEGIKATGKGYNARVEPVLREALEQGRLCGVSLWSLESFSEQIDTSGQLSLVSSRYLCFRSNHNVRINCARGANQAPV